MKTEADARLAAETRWTVLDGSDGGGQPTTARSFGRVATQLEQSSS